MNPSDNDNRANGSATEFKTAAENWKYLRSFDEEDDDEILSQLKDFCREHSVIFQKSDEKSIYYVCKQRNELQCDYEIKYICKQSAIYSKWQHCHAVDHVHEQSNLEEDDHEQHQNDNEAKAEAQKIEVELQENDNETKANVAKTKKDPRGRGGRDDWRYLGQADSIEEVLQEYHGIYRGSFTDNYQHFACKRKKHATNCKYVMRWSRFTRELHEAEEHNHGPIADAHEAEEHYHEPIANNVNLHGNDYVDRYGRVWPFFAQLHNGKSDAEILQFRVEQGCSMRDNKDGRIYFHCGIRNCTFKALLTRANGKIYKLADHNHGKRKRRIKIQKRKKTVIVRQPMQEGNGNGDGEQNYVDSKGKTWRFMVKIKDGSEEELQNFCERNGCKISVRQIIQIGPVVRMRCLVCPFRAIMVNKGRIYSRFKHNHPVNKMGKKKSGPKTPQKVAKKNSFSLAEIERRMSSKVLAREMCRQQKNARLNTIGITPKNAALPVGQLRQPKPVGIGTVRRPSTPPASPDKLGTRLAALIDKKLSPRSTRSELDLDQQPCTSALSLQQQLARNHQIQQPASSSTPTTTVDKNNGAEEEIETVKEKPIPISTERMQQHQMESYNFMRFVSENKIKMQMIVGDLVFTTNGDMEHNATAVPLNQQATGNEPPQEAVVRRSGMDTEHN